jgi:hypothetical protein
MPPIASPAIGSSAAHPSVGWIAAAAAIASGIGFAGGFLAGRGPRDSGATAVASPITAKGDPGPSDMPGLIRRAESGDQEAIASLESKPAESRTVAESLAIASGAAAQKRREALQLGETIAKNPAAADDDAVVKRLRAAADDPETAREALRIMAAIPGPKSADLIYDVWVGTPGRTASTQLAEALVYGPDVRPKASAALSVALDLRRASRCDEFAAILPRAKSDGDGRSLHLLAKLARRRGCGSAKRDDCYPCLRGSGTLNEALAAMQARAKTTP